MIYEYLPPIASQITQDGRCYIVAALLMLISKMGQRVCLSCYDYSGSQYIEPSQSPTKVNIL
jgi:hypothetical protein